MGLFRKPKAKAARVDRIVDLTALERPPALQFGLPSPCPQCGHGGYLDHIDPFREVMYQHCPSCLHRWELSRAQIEAGITA